MNNYPEWIYPPEKLHFKNMIKYIKKYLQPVNLELKGVKIKTQKDPMNWNIHRINNLLTNDKVKFNSR